MESILAIVPHSTFYKSRIFLLELFCCVSTTHSWSSPFTEYIYWLIKQLLAGEDRHIFFIFYLLHSPLHSVAQWFLEFLGTMFLESQSMAQNTVGVQLMLIEWMNWQRNGWANTINCCFWLVDKNCIRYFFELCFIHQVNAWAI